MFRPSPQATVSFDLIERAAGCARKGADRVGQHAPASPFEGAMGLGALSGGALAIFGASHSGIRVSTTHAITGAIVGVGATRGIDAVTWGVAGRVVRVRVLTIPPSAAVAAATSRLLALVGGR